MMFGDMGHGSILLLFAIYIVLFNDSVKKSVLSGASDMRYLFLLMGMMATYCGFIYNEFFAMPMNLFESCYFPDQRQRWNPYLEEQLPVNQTEVVNLVKGEYVYLRRNNECTYAAGFDPVWGLTSNKLAYNNNIKMKLSVIFGIIHMQIGIFHKGANSIFFKRFPDFWLEVVTGTIILLGMFGWMDLLIFAKFFKPVDIEDTGRIDKVKYPKVNDTIGWADESEKIPIYKYNGDFQNENLPGIVNIIITQFLFGDYRENQPYDGDYVTPLIGDTNDQQYFIGHVLLGFVAVLVPVMLCVKPCCFRHRSDDDENIQIIEMANQDDMQQNLLGNNGAIQRDSGDDSSRRLTDDMMMKRHQEMKSLD